MVTSGAETWAPHTHRHHHAAGTTWIFGPEGPANVTGPDPVTAQPQIGSFDFLFWSAGGAQGGGLTYPGGELTPSPTPVFPAGSDPGSLIAWYIGRGGNGPGTPGLVFDAFSEADGDWIDWDQSNDPFTVTSGTRGAPPDGDDEVFTQDEPGTVEAARFFPGTSLHFDRWLVFGANTQVSAGDQEVTQDEGTGGLAIAVYHHPRFRRPRDYVAYDPFWWLKNSPVEVLQQVMRRQSEASQIASLIDLTTEVSNRRTRAMLQRGLYETLISIARAHVEANEELVAAEK